MDLTEEESAPLVNWDTGDCGPDVHRSRSSTAASIQVHLYFTPTTKNAATIHIRSGQRSAENVCIQAAQECGILPVYQSLFALATSDLSCWYHPAHIFHPDENIQVHFRVRFFFGNWFGQGSRTSYRYSLTRDIVSPVLDYCVLDYLFAQLRSDFVASQAGVSPPLTAQEECLGLAVLDLWRMAKERHQSVRELCKTVSYKSCLPKIHCRDIQRRNRLDRFRIRNTLKRFLKKLGSCSMDEHSLKLKYLIELASIEPSLGSETFEVHHSSLHQSKETTLLLVRVSGEAGIFTSFDSLENNQEWQRFCDFQEIIAISVKRVCHEQVPQDSRMVIVTRRDDICLEAKFPSLKEALSFVSLVDGYFRLTTDSCHYFCQEIAPPSLLEAIENHCHGPITSEFAINKLKKSGLKEGAFVLRQSPIDYNNFFLTVCVRSSLGLDYKDCLITKNEHYSLQGVSTDFFRLKELTTFYQHNKLLLADVPVKLKCCCPPSPKEFTNLIILRNGSSVETQSSPTSESNKFSHIEFHMIKYETLTWEECLGQGSFTRVFRGTRADTRDGERHVTEVLLKELDVHHKENCWELFFEAASLMSQISHKHLLHVYGVSVHGANNIMVQEFVKYGALDLYLKRHSMSVSWKLDVAKQLASALNFLEEKNIVHGNICAKNLLLAREGDAAEAISPFIKLSDLGINRAMLGTDVVLDRIPWVAPELLEEPGGLTLECDKWSFGTTLWEIFNNGSAPLPSWDLDKKRQFYETFQQLVPSQWTELAELVSHCMDYQAVLRPSCRSIIRQLNSLITSDYVILQANEPLSQRDCVWRASYTTLQDRTLFEERYLRYTSQLGKGNFGIVELCRYDPMGDNTGELVAVKRLQPNQRSTLQDFSQEIHTLSVLRCDYIVQYRGVCYGTGRLSVSLVMEYMPYGSLMSYLEKNAAHLDVRRLLLFASQICKGMEYLQSMRYVHRDLAARNILVGSEFLVKIADFGLTKIIPYDKEYYRVTQQGESPIFWHAPESIDDSKFSHKSDVWSFGVVLHELFSYCAKSHNPKRLYMQEIGNSIQGLSIFMHLLTILQDNWRLPTPPNCPPMVYAMMRRCWAYDAEERPLFSVLGDQIEDIIQEDI